MQPRGVPCVVEDMNLSARTAWCFAGSLVAGLTAWGVLASPRAVAARGVDARPDRATADALAACTENLRAERPETRRSAVRKLAELGTREAFALVLSALADPEGMVADEAQLAAGLARDPRLVADLVRCCALPTTDEWVRLRAAEALGRAASPVDAQVLLRCATPAAGELARTALWSLERQAGQKRLGGEPEDVARKLAALVARGNDACVRGAALFALRPVDAFRAHDLALELLAERDAAARCAALGVVASFTEQEALTLSTRALADGSPAVRAAAIENLARQKSRSAVSALIAHLETEERSRLRYEILRHLRALSGADHGFDLAAWRAWASTLQGPWSTGGTRPATGPLGDTRVALAGLTLLSDRVSFLIDLSGSMWDTQRGARTRKQIVDEKLRACLEALPKSARFNVIPYTRVPIPWEKQLVPATPANVARAADWFERCHQRGAGNLFDAARLALEDPDVDTLVVLTDGVPTGGRRWHLELMVELLCELNRFRRVAFDSILVDAPRRNRALFADLAARTGGRAITVEAYEDLDGATQGAPGAGGAPKRAGSEPRKTGADRDPVGRPRRPAEAAGPTGAAVPVGGMKSAPTRGADGIRSVPSAYGACSMPATGPAGRAGRPSTASTRAVDAGVDDGPPSDRSPARTSWVECPLRRRPPDVHDAPPLPVLLASQLAGRRPRGCRGHAHGPRRPAGTRHGPRRRPYGA